MLEGLTEELTLKDVAELFPHYEITRVWTSKEGVEYADDTFTGSASWHYAARKRLGGNLNPFKADTMFELIEKIVWGAEVFQLDQGSGEKE